MATAWDDTTYPLSDKTRFRFPEINVVDYMSDGTVRNRKTSTVTPVRLDVSLAPLSAVDSAVLEGVLVTGFHTEYDFTIAGVVYRGYIESSSVSHRVTNGDIHWWTFVLRGVRV
jgi:hypothetical protein